jgi:hypothetical protein
LEAQLFLLGEHSQNVLVFHFPQVFWSGGAAGGEEFARTKQAADVVCAEEVGHLVASG